MTADDALKDLAAAAGISPRWRDVTGQERDVAPETLRRILTALGLAADSAQQIAESRAALEERAKRLYPLITTTCGPDGCAVAGARPGDAFRLDLEGGGRIEGKLEQGWGGEARLPALHEQGYHRLSLPEGQATIAAAPPRCFGLPDAGAAHHAGGPPWGLAVQTYALRRRGDLGIGDFGGVADFARAAARRGAAALAISPVHALFPADPTKYSPYAPSTRLFLNVLHADPRAALGDVEWEGEDPQDELIDWQRAARNKLDQLRRLAERHLDHPGFVGFRREAGPALEDHARFEALHAHMLARDPALWHWSTWPEGLRHPRGAEVQDFAREHAQEVAIRAFWQWLADESFRAAQRAAVEAGMPVGLINDLAVGTESGGSHAWSHPGEILSGLSVGAPPDELGPRGQDWGLTAFSPREMQEGGFHAFIELLRAAMRRAGGVRVDHLMGLARLWVIPHGSSATEGAYIRFPLDDLLRLLALESHRHRCVVIGEDLGTVPEGFKPRVEATGLLGMRVLWFEREQDGRFRPPREWSRGAVAMTTTHDLPTVVGWWAGRDIEWRERLDLHAHGTEVEHVRAERARDRAALWQAFSDSGAAEGDPPPPEEGVRVAKAALAHVGDAACALALVPVEDALALPEQPNLPGTSDEHPNWRRRLPGEAAALLDAPEAEERLRALAEARRRAGEG